MACTCSKGHLGNSPKCKMCGSRLQLVLSAMSPGCTVPGWRAVRVDNANYFFAIALR